MAAEASHSSSGYILHHLTYLKLDLQTMRIDPEATGFWVVNLDSVFFSILLGFVFVACSGRGRARATGGVPASWQNFVETCIEFVDRQVKDAFHQNRNSWRRWRCWSASGCCS